jgi:nitric oxide reductase activation protein
MLADAVEHASDISIKDNNSALETGVSEVTKQDARDLKPGEAPWKPYDPGQDTVTVVRPSSKGLTYDQEQAAFIVKSVKSESAYLRARLRMVVQALEMTSTVHGVPKGKGLSSRFLVDSKASLKAREIPQKAYFRRGQRLDMSMACAVVLDESGSMDTSLQDCTRIMVALTEPLDALNYPTMAIGFRDGLPSRYGHFDYRDAQQCHRTEGVNYDIFKMWHERFNTVKWRFANTRATGGTPMADGIQYALRALNAREEAHRFMFVITDGCPNGGHEPVIKYQLRVAKEAGIHIIGVGMGDNASYVKDLFDDYIWVPNVQYVEAETLNERGNRVRTKEKVNGISLLPKLLIAKLNELVDRRVGFRGKTLHGI